LMFAGEEHEALADPVALPRPRSISSGPGARSQAASIAFGTTRMAVRIDVAVEAAGVAREGSENREDERAAPHGPAHSLPRVVERCAVRQVLGKKQ